jgi:hypothetical protein
MSWDWSGGNYLQTVTGTCIVFEAHEHHLELISVILSSIKSGGDIETLGSSCSVPEDHPTSVQKCSVPCQQWRNDISSLRSSCFTKTSRSKLPAALLITFETHITENSLQQNLHFLITASALIFTWACGYLTLSSLQFLQVCLTLQDSRCAS